MPGEPALAQGLWIGAGELSAWKNGEGWLAPPPKEAIALAGPWFDICWTEPGLGEGVGTDIGPAEGEGAGNIVDGEGLGWCNICELGFGLCWLRWLRDGGEARFASEGAAGLNPVGFCYRKFINIKRLKLKTEENLKNLTQSGVLLLTCCWICGLAGVWGLDLPEAAGLEGWCLDVNGLDPEPPGVPTLWSISIIVEIGEGGLSSSDWDLLLNIAFSSTYFDKKAFNPWVKENSPRTWLLSNIE
jgi:hypothetical protein